MGLDDDMLYAPSEALFLLPSMAGLAARNARVEVDWDLPRGWRSFTGWPEDVFYGTRQLLKTNILGGDIELHEASACGLDIDIAVYGEWTFDPGQIASDMARLACAPLDFHALRCAVHFRVAVVTPWRDLRAAHPRIERRTRPRDAGSLTH